MGKTKKWQRVYDHEMSAAERDRRWGLLRREMEANDLECLLVSGFHSVLWEAQATLRWVTNLDIEGYLVFPREGEPTLYSFIPRPKVTRREDCWVPDCRSGFPGFGESLVAGLTERGVTGGKVGVLSMAGVFGEYGGFPYSTMATLEAELPAVRLEDSTAWFAPLRMRKSDEEVRMFEIAAAIAKDVVGAVTEVAREGVTDAEIRATIAAARTRAGAEPHSTTFYGQGKDIAPILDTGVMLEPGYSTPLEVGDVIATELTNRVNGYEAEFNQAWVLGEADEEWERMFVVAAESFEAGVVALRPGIDTKELQALMQAPLDEAGFTWFFPFFHGSGLMDEPPSCNVRVSNYADGREIERPYPAITFEPNMTLTFEPNVVTKDRYGDDETAPWLPRRGLSLGTSVVVTEEGCRVLAEEWWKPEVIRLPA
ncbi:MAG: aminopeptidase P family protein [Actinobacteria bacterium]|nr:aminopeptidase P family protein [Actinomycetota bacterium]